MMDLRPLLSCFAVASLSIAIWGHLPARLVEGTVVRRITLGLVTGLGATLSMLVPLRIVDSVFVDLRAPLLGATAFIGGPLSALVAVVLPLIYRLYTSGPGVWSGCGAILLAAGIGIAGHAIAAGRPATMAGLAALAASIAASTPLTFALLPRAFWAASLPAVAPLAAMSFCGTILFVLSLQRDERHRKLVAQDALYRAIIEALPDSLSAKDPQSRFLAANPATARLMGVSSVSDVIGKTDGDFYPPKMAKFFRDEELTVLDNVTVGPIDQEVEFMDGSKRWLTSMKTPMLDAKGRVVGILTHNRNVTDRKKLETELQNTQSFLQEAMNNMEDGLVLYDQDRRIRFCNQQYTSMFPKTADLRIAGSQFEHIIRASMLRGEVKTTMTVDDYVAERIRLFNVSGESLMETNDGRTMELRTRVLPGSDTLVLFIDVTAKKKVERDLIRRALQDPLTSLANRAAFETEMNTAHAQATVQNTSYAVMMLDLDRFKPVNDTFGHAVGDKLLVEVATRLRHCVQEGTLVARLGGDEFAFLIRGPDIEDAAARIANRVVSQLRKPFHTDGIELVPSGSLGIAHFPSDAADPFELLRLADKALYAVKTKGGGAWAASAAESLMRGQAKVSAAIQSAA